MKKVVVLGTGGTIAGTAQNVSDNVGYTAAQVGVGQLLAGVPGLHEVLSGCELVSHQVAQLDSKDMTHTVWQALACQINQRLSDPDVQAVVVTHGTDTLEETAYFLHCVLPATLTQTKPVVLTCAMRPASALSPDGPQNLKDACVVALTPGAHGVVVVCAGVVHSAVDVQKNHTYRLDAFSSGDVGPLGYVEEGALRLVKNWPLAHESYGSEAIENIAKMAIWPRVEVVMSHAGCSGAVVDALCRPALGVPVLHGLVVAATGNGTVHDALVEALRRAQESGVQVLRASRCATGRVLSTGHDEFAHAKGLSPVKARVALMLRLMLVEPAKI